MMGGTVTGRSEPLEEPVHELVHERGHEPMDLAVSVARQGHRGANPLVGAVITGPDGEVLVTGHHRGRGTDHAEVEALRRFEALRADPGDQRVPAPAECTLHVTLEPCDHTGTTGPCSLAILTAGIGSVRYAQPDPTGPDGGGVARLRRWSVMVEQVGDHGASRELNERWFRARDAGRPFVTGHLAQTLDGKVAAADGTSQWITGTASREHAHRVRSRVDAIVVGTGTVLTDNPRLTARDPQGRDHPVQPLPVVQGHRPLPAGAALRGRDWLQVPDHDPAAVLAALRRHRGPWPHGGRSCGHLLIEGGPTVLSAWLAAGLVDELFIYQAPIAVGGGVGGLEALPVRTLSEAVHLDWDETETGGLSRRGDDALLHLSPADTTVTAHPGTAHSDTGRAPADRHRTHREEAPCSPASSPRPASSPN